MSDNLPPTNGSASADSRQPLAERVHDRVVAARRALERRDRAVQPRLPRRRPRRAPPPAEPGSPEREELRALRSVFRELGVAHRSYRQRTGAVIEPELRAAAEAFKRAPSLVALVPVAGFLEELDLLTW